MAQKTNLNAAPYYDDFSESNNYVRTLFRPGFAVQARELNQLQSQLQYQIEAHGSHVFKEGAAVVPGHFLRLWANAKPHSTGCFAGAGA